jgi:dual specificity MAP kinase phosphatase
MYKLSLNMNDAFNMVRARKSNIAPNFHFMEQLLNFERELAISPKDAPEPTQGILSMSVILF